MYVGMHVCIHAGMDIKICTDVYGMYMCICEHAYVWGKQKGEGGKTPGCRNSGGRLRVLKPCPTARPLPASLQSRLYPPPPCFGQCPHIRPMHQHHLHTHGAQCDGGQHVPSLATSVASRRLRASRNNPALRAPKVPQPLHLCALRQPARKQARRHRRKPVGWAACTALCVDAIPPPSCRGSD